MVVQLTAICGAKAAMKLLCTSVLHRQSVGLLYVYIFIVDTCVSMLLAWTSRCCIESFRTAYMNQMLVKYLTSLKLLVLVIKPLYQSP